MKIAYIDRKFSATFDTYKSGWLVSFPFGDRRFFGSVRSAICTAAMALVLAIMFSAEKIIEALR